MNLDTIMAFDPGGTTGWASYGMSIPFNDNNDLKPIFTGEFKGSTCIPNLTPWEGIVICERPFIKPFTDTIVFEVKGVVERYAVDRGCILHMYEPSRKNTARQMFDLKERKILRGTEHSQDAFCHLLYYLTHRPINPIPAKKVFSMYEIGWQTQRGEIK